MEVWYGFSWKVDVSGFWWNVGVSVMSGSVISIMYGSMLAYL